MCEGDKSHVVNGAMSYHGNVSLPRAVRLFPFSFFFSFFFFKGAAVYMGGGNSSLQ